MKQIKFHKNQIRIPACILLLFCLLLVPGTLHVSGAELLPVGQEIRVGLTALYSGKNSITVSNTKLGFGYCTGKNYLQEAVFYSRDGFTFTPEMGYTVRVNERYGSYAAAKRVADELLKAGYEAYPACVYQCTWYVYLGADSSYEKMLRLSEHIMQNTKYKDVSVLGGSNYRMRVTGSQEIFLIDVDEHSTYPQFRPLTLYNGGTACIDLGTRVYRGRIEIGRYNKTTLTAVNIVPLEEYLYSVVASEMPSFWNIEALKAQAVCARSYALVRAGYQSAGNVKKAYKIVDTTASQVYKGYLAETEKTTKAVDETRGEMVCYDNKVVAAYFFSTSGGRTESSKEAWAVGMPYLVSVPDRYETNPERKPWIVTMTGTELTELFSYKGISLGNIQSIKPLSYTETGRVHTLSVTGTEDRMILQEAAIRTLLNLYSTKFKVVRAGDTPDLVNVMGAAGQKTLRIRDASILSADSEGRVQKTKASSQSLAQYVVAGADDLMNYPRSAPSKADEFMFAGMGYGHGVGMSQSGARGMAEAGFNYKEIIEYYFTGANVR